jgi:lysylphosphatidylglycerol synthetase-like protein (DUF2156 family)
MTQRQLGALVIKLLGVHYAIASFLMLGAFVAQYGALLRTEMDRDSRGAILATSIVSIVGFVFAAAVCVLKGDAIAEWLFSSEQIAQRDISRRDLLFVGVALIATSVAISGMPGLVRLAAEGIWYAEATRQPFFWDAVQKSSGNITDSVFAIVVGVAIAMSARRLAAALDSRAS